MPRPSSDHPVLRAAVRWRDRCLLNGGSVFTEKSLWTSENVAHLVKHYAENLDEGEGTFIEKLDHQLARAPGSAKQLAAEMFWVMYLFPVPGALQPGTKRQQIRQVWEWSGEKLPDSSELDQALNDGIGTPGTAFITHRWRELLFFVRMMEAWTPLPEVKRRNLLADAWRFAEWLEEQDETGTRLMRHILLYLLFPSRFELFASASQKRSIVRAFAKKFGDDLPKDIYKDRIALDRQVLVVREQVQKKEGAAADFDFHDEPYLQVWRPEGASVEGGGSDGEDLVSPEEAERWYRERFGDHRVWGVHAGVAGARFLGRSPAGGNHCDRVGPVGRSSRLRE